MLKHSCVKLSCLWAGLIMRGSRSTCFYAQRLLLAGNDCECSQCQFGDRRQPQATIGRKGFCLNRCRSWVRSKRRSPNSFFQLLKTTKYGRDMPAVKKNRKPQPLQPLLRKRTTECPRSTSRFWHLKSSVREVQTLYWVHMHTCPDGERDGCKIFREAKTNRQAISHFRQESTHFGVNNSRRVTTSFK